MIIKYFVYPVILYFIRDPVQVIETLIMDHFKHKFIIIVIIIRVNSNPIVTFIMAGLNYLYYNIIARAAE